METPINSVILLFHHIIHSSSQIIIFYALTLIYFHITSFSKHSNISFYISGRERTRPCTGLIRHAASFCNRSMSQMPRNPFILDDCFKKKLCHVEEEHPSHTYPGSSSRDIAFLAFPLIFYPWKSIQTSIVWPTNQVHFINLALRSKRLFYMVCHRVITRWYGNIDLCELATCYLAV